ncbi:hypothetical protein Ga0123461_0083 [Mariprofundus aestuarium]|uniref:Antitoxin VbhA domain-containing protein n=1 Tax=Mariprofundus aestuarium TaxID=1921086 RepID=A0A2K8L2S3_MARES|nr:hypothetical protein [Mariprofundus aestuarium]ATX78536.1 hypothetical protein Ga0123461_0083 [Mariprofundus aestuarium]
MGEHKLIFDTAEQWREEAMRRPDGVDYAESEKRRAQADAHNKLHSISSPDVLIDQQLYILGKMDMEEYQSYLLFKHSKSG